MNKIEKFTLHNALGEMVLAVDLLSWASQQSEWKPFNTTKYSWIVAGKEFEADSKTGSWWVLPDSSGFVCFERSFTPDNCVLLDAYGKERIRLKVPWELTGRDISEDAKMFFVNISGPFDNPTTGEKGTFGVSACIESADDYFFIATHCCLINL